MTAVRDDIGLIAATALGRAPSRRELKHLAEAAAGPGGLHALRRLLARAWMITRTRKRTAISETDIKAAAGDSAWRRARPARNHWLCSKIAGESRVNLTRLGEQRLEGIIAEMVLWMARQNLQTRKGCGKCGSG